MQIPEAVLAALKTKNLKTEALKAWLFEGPDLFLHLAGGRVERVEVSALPASLPLPETTAGEQGSRGAGEQGKKQRSRKKKGVADGD